MSGLVLRNISIHGISHGFPVSCIPRSQSTIPLFFCSGLRVPPKKCSINDHSWTPKKIISPKYVIWSIRHRYFGTILGWHYNHPRFFSPMRKPLRIHLSSGWQQRQGVRRLSDQLTADMTWTMEYWLFHDRILRLMKESRNNMWVGFHPLIQPTRGEMITAHVIRGPWPKGTRGMA